MCTRIEIWCLVTHRFIHVYGHSVCVFVCVYICMYLYTRAHIYIRLYIYTHIYIRVYIYTHIYIYTYVYMHTIRLYSYLCTSIHDYWAAMISRFLEIMGLCCRI